MKLTNNHDISLPMAVWLIYDEYDLVKEEKYISVTSLLKPIRQIVLKHRLDSSELSMDIIDMTATSLGTGIHDSVEKAWHLGHKDSLRKLGYPERVVENVVINPTPEQVAANPNIIPVYMEQRAIREIAGWKVGGKFDIVTEGLLHDIKSTATYTWVKGGRDEEHKLQGSLYKWLNPDKITYDFIRINYIFTDWMKGLASNPAYPPRRIMHKDITLFTEKEIEKWTTDRLSLVTKYWNAPQKEIPECTPDELWQSEPVFKYYSDPAKAKEPGAKSSKNFDNAIDARKHQAEKGKGVVVTVPGEVKRCLYCAVATICEQRLKYFP